MRADKNQVLPLLKTARGQIDGLLRMIDDDRYCVDISNQILATRALLDKCNRVILAAHLQGCVSEALKDGNEEKIEEVIALIEKMVK